MTDRAINLTTHDGTAVIAMAESVVVPLYVATHRERLDDPFYSAGRFTERLAAYARREGFACVLAVDSSVGSFPVGQAFGFPLPAGSRWWEGLRTPVPEGFTHEDGRRTFAVNEIMVLPEYQRRGIAHRLHDELLRPRQEERATLLVRADNAAARRAYQRWGYGDVARVQPFEDSPVYHGLVLDLQSRCTAEPE